MIWYNKRIIVVHAPRCAGTSFEELLRYNASCHSLKRKLLWKIDSRVHLDGPMRTGLKHLRASDWHLSGVNRESFLAEGVLLHFGCASERHYSSIDRCGWNGVHRLFRGK